METVQPESTLTPGLIDNCKLSRLDKTVKVGSIKGVVVKEVKDLATVAWRLIPDVFVAITWVVSAPLKMVKVIPVEIIAVEIGLRVLLI